MSSTTADSLASPETRGQTEPIAALVAISLVCVAISVYATFATGMVPDLESDREYAAVTSERIWNELGEDGLYPVGVDVRNDITAEMLPRGQRVFTNVTYVGDSGHVVEHDRAGFDEAGEPTAMEPPGGGEVYERPVPVKLREGDVRPGRLTVVVAGGESG